MRCTPIRGLSLPTRAQIRSSATLMSPTSPALLMWVAKTVVSIAVVLLGTRAIAISPPSPSPFPRTRFRPRRVHANQPKKRLGVSLNSPPLGESSQRDPPLPSIGATPLVSKLRPVSKFVSGTAPSKSEPRALTDVLYPETSFSVPKRRVSFYETGTPTSHCNAPRGHRPSPPHANPQVT